MDLLFFHLTMEFISQLSVILLKFAFDFLTSNQENTFFLNMHLCGLTNYVKFVEFIFAFWEKMQNNLAIVYLFYLPF